MTRLRFCGCDWRVSVPNRTPNKCRYMCKSMKNFLHITMCRKLQIFLHLFGIGSSTCPSINWAAPSEFGTYRLCEQRRFRRACASAQSRQNLRCSLIQAVSQEEPSDRKPDPWLLWMAGHAQLKVVMTECSKTQIRLTGPNCNIQTPLHPKSAYSIDLQ